MPGQEIEHRPSLVGEQLANPAFKLDGREQIVATAHAHRQRAGDRIGPGIVMWSDQPDLVVGARARHHPGSDATRAIETEPLLPLLHTS
jgi:hypothetical protein